MSTSESVGSNTQKKLIKIDISSDTMCPWCIVDKKNLDKAIAASKDYYDFEIRWHLFQLNPSAPKEGSNKKEYYRNKFGSQTKRIEARMSEVFRGHGLEYNLSGLTGNTLDNHRLMHFAGQQGLWRCSLLATSLKQNLLVTNCQIDHYSFFLNRVL